MSSKRAAAVGTRDLTVYLLTLIATNIEIADNLFNSKKQKTRKLREMRKAGYLTKARTLTKKGRRTVDEGKIWSLTIPHPTQWDYKWRMVLFDIPAKKSSQRNSFRARLKELGLVLYQRSVWVYPYPLEETIRAISNFYMISDCVLFAVAEDINNASALRKHFNL